MKERGLGGAGADFQTTLCALYSFINVLQYTIVKEKTFRGERRCVGYRLLRWLLPGKT